MNEIKFVQMTRVEIKSLITDAIREYENLLFIEHLKEERILSKNEAARRLEISYNTLRRKIDSGLIKQRPDGKISEKALNDYLNL